MSLRNLKQLAMPALLPAGVSRLSSGATHP